jgi:hypothetical protein
MKKIKKDGTLHIYLSWEKEKYDTLSPASDRAAGSTSTTSQIYFGVNYCLRSPVIMDKIYSCHTSNFKLVVTSRLTHALSITIY